MKKRLDNMWARERMIYVTDIENDYFLVRFEKKKDMEFALLAGPWRFPLEYVNASLMKTMGDWLGKFVRLDSATTNLARGKFARISVELDLNKPLKSENYIEGRYKQSQNVNLVKDGSGTIDEGIPADSYKGEGDDSSNNFGPWMVVTKARRSRPQIERGGNAQNNNQKEGQLVGKNNAKDIIQSNEEDKVEQIVEISDKVSKVPSKQVGVSRKCAAKDRVQIVETDSNFKLVMEGKDGVLYELKDQDRVNKKVQDVSGYKVGKEVGKGNQAMEENAMEVDKFALNSNNQIKKHLNVSRSIDQEVYQETSSKIIIEKAPKPPDPGATNMMEVNKDRGGISRNETTALLMNLMLQVIIEEAIGFSGGIWVLWDSKKVTVHAISQSSQFVHMKVSLDQSTSFLCTTLYASPQETRRHTLWEEIIQMSHSINDPWILADIDGLEGRLTWQGRKWNLLFKKLNRVCANMRWRISFEDAEVRALPRFLSDHNPLLLDLAKGVNQWSDRPFRFIAPWMDHPGFGGLMEEKWSSDVEVKLMLANFIPHLKKWNKEVFGNISYRIRNLTQSIADIQLKRERVDSLRLQKLEEELHDNLNLTLDQEELLWFQKSRHNWIIDGDKNTKFYHLKTVMRRSSNRISRLCNNDNIWIEDPNELKVHVCNYYKDLFSEEVRDRRWISFQNLWPILEQNEIHALMIPPSDHDIWQNLSSMGPYKAPGDYGYPHIFFQTQWKKVKVQVCNVIKNMWQHPEMIEDCNYTLLVLIPKKKIPDYISQCRLVSLCTVIYKLFSKIIVYRIKMVLEKIISPFQASFVSHRQIQDNITIVQELIHSTNKMKGRKAFMAFKIDLVMAYDRVSWQFMRRIIEEIQFPKAFINIIMKCLSTSRINVLWNGDKTVDFAPSTGLRQRDPLSPYLGCA
ncbi:uncharacterized protein LOC133287406 [Gastrolobium bilobum]|uniref:uncharacterized protein LOC133287406 n=1 Tax=Gastrolobium bilobum TaxID=150636 RepID=UPI002AB02ED7|nr:uncharacterized protein LOC133287406 [Gastrolobium bilobum]